MSFGHGYIETVGHPQGQAMKYPLVIEKVPNNYAGYAPDFPGLGVTGDSVEEVRQLLVEGIAIYLEELASTGERAPVPNTVVAFAEVGSNFKLTHHASTVRSGTCPKCASRVTTGSRCS